MPPSLSDRLHDGIAHATYLAYRAGAEVVRVVPGAVVSPLAHGVAQLAPAVMRERRHQVERNLRRVYGPELDGIALQRAVTATFDSYGRYWYELFRLPNESPEWVQQHFRGLGEEHIADAIAAGRGAVVALPHLGSWDFAGAWLSGRGYQVSVVAEVLEPPELYEWFVETRRALGMRVVPLSANAAAEMLAALRHNEVICLLCDRDLTGDGVEVEFFGERTTMPGGPALLALRSGAPLIPVGCYFRPDERGEARIGPPLPAERSGSIREDIARVTQALAHRFEELIRDAPEHWHLMQPNWPSDHV
ncbi:MAG: phosphatidylinositol mannoside acyltransferase [Acidimicrobiia bacterium]